MSHEQQAADAADKAKLLTLVLPGYNAIRNGTQQAAYAEAAIGRGGPTYGHNKVRLQLSDFPGMTTLRAQEISAGNAQWNTATAWFDGQDRPGGTLTPSEFNALLDQAGIRSH